MLPLDWDLGQHDLDLKQSYNQRLDSSPTARQERLAVLFTGEEFTEYCYQIQMVTSCHYYSENYPKQTELRSYSQDSYRTQAEMEDAGKWNRLWVPPSQLEPCPAATETDIHANHNRNERPDHTTTHLGSHFNWPASLPAQQTTSYPTRGSSPVPAQTDWDKLEQPPPPLPPTLPLHCALQQPLLRGLIPRSDHHLSLLCWHN